MDLQMIDQEMIEALEKENARLENENVELRNNLKGAKKLVDALGEKHDYWMNRCKKAESENFKDSVKIIVD